MNKARKDQLKELSHLVPGVLRRKEGALERFNTKAAELGLAPGINARTEFSKYKQVYEHLLKNSEGVNFADSESIKRMCDAITEDYERNFEASERYDGHDYCDCVTDIAVTCDGKAGLVASASISSWPGGANELDTQRTVNLINVLGACDIDTMNLRLKILDPDYESAFILQESINLFLKGKDLFPHLFRIEEEFALITFLIYWLDFDVKQKERLAPHAADRLYKLTVGAIDRKELDPDNMTTLYDNLYWGVSKLTRASRKHFSAAVMLAAPLIQSQSDRLHSLVVQIGDPVLLAWYQNSWLHKESDARLERLENQLGNIERRMNDAISSLSESKISLEDIHKGYARKYAEAVSSGNFGVLDYKGTRIIYALVNSEDIEELGIHSNGFILVARDAAVDENGNEDPDLQRIVAVHEYVESIHLKDRISLEEAHKLAVEAEKEFVQTHGLQDKYDKFMPSLRDRQT